ncbi:unnamed protein product [Rotaria sp. Silwood2]|nr:unnamed protein product [Rotaria sp. Silwood2]CAF4153527.1 unnamed protein product [Rotaria sp. Silwood2]
MYDKNIEIRLCKLSKSYPDIESIISLRNNLKDNSGVIFDYDLSSDEEPMIQSHQESINYMAEEIDSDED